MVANNDIRTLSLLNELKLNQKDEANWENIGHLKYKLNNFTLVPFGENPEDFIIVDFNPLALRFEISVFNIRTTKHKVIASKVLEASDFGFDISDMLVTDSFISMARSDIDSNISYIALACKFGAKSNITLSFKFAQENNEITVLKNNLEGNLTLATIEKGRLLFLNPGLNITVYDPETKKTDRYAQVITGSPLLSGVFRLGSSLYINVLKTLKQEKPISSNTIYSIDTTTYKLKALTVPLFSSTNYGCWFGYKKILIQSFGSTFKFDPKTYIIDKSNNTLVNSTYFIPDRRTSGPELAKKTAQSFDLPAIVGGTIGGLAALVLLLAMVTSLIKRSKRKKLLRPPEILTTPLWIDMNLDKESENFSLTNYDTVIDSDVNTFTQSNSSGNIDVLASDFASTTNISSANPRG